MALAKNGTVVSLERPIVPSKPEETKADGKPHGVAFYEIRFKTFPADDPRGNRVQQRHPGIPRPRRDDAPRRALPRQHRRQAVQRLSAPRRVSETIGCTKLGLDNLKEGIVTRGVLIDMTRLKSASRTAGAARVYAEDIEAWEKQAGFKVSPGDALFVYNRRRGGNGGFDLSVVPWMKARGVAVTSNVRAAADDRHADHRLVLVALGTYLLDGVALDGLADTEQYVICPGRRADT